MNLERQIVFHPFRLDGVNERLWRGSELIPLRPKSFAVLRYLVEHRGQLVSKKELMQVVWADAHVTDAVLKVCIREIREGLGEEAAVPRFIETEPRRGYRFIGEVNGPHVSGALRQLAHH